MLLVLCFNTLLRLVHTVPTNNVFGCLVLLDRCVNLVGVCWASVKVTHFKSNSQPKTCYSTSVN